MTRSRRRPLPAPAPKPDRAALARFDDAAREVAAWSRQAFADALAEVEPEEQAQLLRMRWRWRLDEFAADAMRECLARTGPVGNPNAIDAAFFDVPPIRRGDPGRGVMRLIMTGRGIGKTTRQKIRAFHGLIYGVRRFSVAICGARDDAIGWVDTIRSWAAEPSAVIRLAFPELHAIGNRQNVTLITRFNTGKLAARSFGGALRGINADGLRPDALDLDDVETEDRSVTEAARDANAAKIVSKVLPLAPIEGGAEVWWSQTPVHHDCAAVRAYRGAEGMEGFDARRVPVITSWPDRSDLWDQCRAIFFDVDAHGDRREAAVAARAFYEARRAEMDAGAELLDPLRLDAYEVHAKLWSMGASAFAREMRVEIGKYGGSLFRTDAWPRFTRHDDRIVYNGREIPLASAKMHAHIDTSDGGDDGALAAVALIGGRIFALRILAWRGATLSVQIPAMAREIAALYRAGLRSFSWEPPPGAASVVRDYLIRALAAEGCPLRPKDWPSTENKAARIVGTLEVPTAGGLIAVASDADPRVLAVFDGYDPAASRPSDDPIDALQRCVEVVTPPARRVTASAVLAAFGGSR